MGFKCLRKGTNLTLNSAEDLCVLPACREYHTAWEIWGRTENRHRGKLSSNREVSDHGAGGQEPLELETAGEASCGSNSRKGQQSRRKRQRELTKSEQQQLSQGKA